MLGQDSGLIQRIQLILDGMFLGSIFVRDRYILDVNFKKKKKRRKNWHCCKGSLQASQTRNLQILKNSLLSFIAVGFFSQEGEMCFIFLVEQERELIASSASCNPTISYKLALSNMRQHTQPSFCVGFKS